MRVHLQQDVNAGQFADQLLALGDGRLCKEPNTDTIKLPEDFSNIVHSIEQLQDMVFPNILQNYRDHSWMCYTCSNK
uniref:Uncharacterized protein n=1 Tax=Arion vulgaris TaxID=1028688 RepID=A0A0B7BQ87_9EUPU